MTTNYYYNYIRTTYLEKYKKTGKNGCILSTFSGGIFTDFWLEIDVSFLPLNRQCYVASIQLFYSITY